MPDFTGVRFDNSKRKARSVKTLPVVSRYRPAS